MLKHLLLFAILFPCCAFPQQGDTTASAGLPSAPLSQPAQSKPREPGPVGALTFGYVYLASQTAPNGPWNFHLQGFFGIPQYNVKPWFSLFADFTQSYNTSRGAHENVQTRLGGFLFTAKAKARISPFAFVDAGAIRDSKSGTVTNSPGLAAGGGTTLKLTKRIGLLIIPGEYVRTYAPGGSLNNFTGRFGIVLPFTSHP